MPPASTPPDPLARFSDATRAWFSDSFAAPTPAQSGAWAATSAGASVLVSAPTGSGKTLAAFLAAIDRLLTSPTPAAGAGAPARTRVLYVSPLKALAYDVDRNLRAPLAGITRMAQLAGVAVPTIDVGMRTGDTPADERRRLARRPPDILITTPESLFLLLTSRAREGLASVETVIVDEVHAVAGTKRGAHLAVTLERLEALRRAAAPQGEVAAPLQRIGLSATQRPLEEVARFLGGGTCGAGAGGTSAAGGGGAGGGGAGHTWIDRPVTIVEAKSDKALELEIVVPVEDMGRLGELLDEPGMYGPDAPGMAGGPGRPGGGPAAGAGESRRSIWPSVQPAILDLILGHRSTIVFCNSRRLSERLCARINELAAAREEIEDGHLIARAHHGSVAREERAVIEEALKAGQLRCVVATSSLELGIDMGAVDLVVQVESPGSVASGLQRVGRAGHQVGAASVGKIFPKYRGDLVECAVVARRMLDGEVETTQYPRTPLDVLAQQIVAMAAMDPWQVEDLLTCVRGAAGFAELTRAQLDGVLDMLSGRYPSDEFAELRPRITWDRVEDRITGRPSAQRLAVTSGGTIPDRGLYGVFIVGEGANRRVGELDEEMVYEARPGETFTLGTSTWRIEDITRDQVLVTPAPGEPGKLPFWHGDAQGRPAEVGRAVGAFLREVGDEPDSARTLDRLEQRYGLDPLAASNLLAYVEEQREATGVIPSDRTIVVERFRDEIGDWRVVVHSPFGGRVHSPWALAIEARARERLGMDVQTMVADDGIVLRLPEAAFDGDRADHGEHGKQCDRLGDEAASILIDPADVEDLVVGELANSALFAARFRECAARALLLPRRRPGGRTPLWQQRQKAADLLAVASRYGSFPILLETYRECLRDVFDVPALVDVLRAIAARSIRVVQVETQVASPFASSLLFSYVAGYMYEGDAPLAERRASALSLDRELLAELLGSDELRDLIDPEALDALELELQRLTPERRARHLDAVHDLLRDLGDLRIDEVLARTAAETAVVEGWLEELHAARRVYPVRVAGEQRFAAAEDAARFRDALGVPPPRGLPDAFLEPVDRPTVDLVARYARTHGPFRTGEVAGRLGMPVDAVELALKELDREGRITAGEFRPLSRLGGVGSGREWCDAEVLRRLRRRSLAALRKEVEPVEPEALGRFLPGWQGVGSRIPGVDRLFEVVEQLQGMPLVVSTLERDVLAVRVAHYNPAWLDELMAAGEVVWVGRGALGSGDGRVSLYVRDQAPLLAPLPAVPAVAPGDPAAEHAIPHDAIPAVAGPEAPEWWTRRHAALLASLVQRGASFWPQVYAALLQLGPIGEGEALEVLWDLVWAGLVTNDALTPLRALTGTGARVASPRRGRRARTPRAPRALSRSGPARAAGRWSLVSTLLEPVPSGTERATALAAQLLDRHGIVTREVAGLEDLAGGFSSVYGVLKAMEDAGRARRGYFIEGLGGAQFAVPGAIDRLRSVREPGMQSSAASSEDGGGDVVVLAATDPANPYGAAVAWPAPMGAGRHTPRRGAGAHVVLVDGHLTAYVEKGGRSLLTFSDDAAVLVASARALAELVVSGRVRTLQLQRIDGAEPADQPVLAHLRASGFVDHPRGLVRRP